MITETRLQNKTFSHNVYKELLILTDILIKQESTKLNYGMKNSPKYYRNN